MPKILPASFAVATLLAAGLFALQSEPRTVGSSALGFTGTDLVREAAIVCGGNGCNTVQTKAQKRRKFQTLGHG